MIRKLISWLRKPRLLDRIRNKILLPFFLDQWIVYIAPELDYKSLSWSGFKEFVPPRDRFWADPFIWSHENRHHIFIEELPYSTMRGYIICLTLDEEMKIISNQVVLERPYHLSYPFLFEHNNQLYMLPETRENNRIELYRCIHFPDQWELEKTLIDNIGALDSTLLEFNGKWWMFATVPGAGNSAWDSVNLYYSDSPLSDRWTPHPLNPVVKDINSARPAGRIFSHNGNLIRPSQNCSVDYGYAVNFNRIVNLTETEYSENLEHTFEPPMNSKIIATHTFNSMGGLTTIDAIKFRRKF
jgi:hypothetical protein